MNKQFKQNFIYTYINEEKEKTTFRQIEEEKD